jgi:hypothetical protein
MSKKPRLGRDPFKDEGPLSFIRDTRGGPAPKPGNIGNIGNTKIPRPGERRGRPKGSGAKDPTKWKRATFILNRETLAKLKARAYRDRITVTELLDRALDAYLKGKSIKPIGSK